MNIFWILALFVVLNSSLVRSDNKDEQLLDAATNGNTQKIQSLLTEGANINTVNRYGETPLFLACSHDHTEAALLLIEKGADVHVKNQFGGSALERAVAHDLSAVAISLIKNGAEVNGVDNEGNAPLLVACRQRKEGMVQLLLAHGANPSIANSDGTTPLMEASKNGLVDTVKLLIEKGANINGTNRMNQTALHVVATSKHSLSSVQRYEIIKILLENGVDINAKDNKGRTAYESAKVLGYGEISEIKPKAPSEIDQSEIAHMKADISYLKEKIREEEAGANIARKLSVGLLSGLEDAENLIKKFQSQLRSLINENDTPVRHPPSQYVTPDPANYETDLPKRFHPTGTGRPNLNTDIGNEDRYEFDERNRDGMRMAKSGTSSNYALYFSNCILLIAIQMFVNA